MAAETPADVYEAAARAQLEMIASWYDEDVDDPGVQEILAQIPKRAAHQAFRAAVDVAYAAGKATAAAELAEARREQEKLATTGEWVTEGGWIIDGEFQRWISGSFAAPTHQRRVWRRPVTAVEAGTTMEETT